LADAPVPTPQVISVAHGGGLTVSLAQTTVNVYIITEEMLESVSYLNTTNAVFLGLAGMFSGVFATALATLLGTTLTDPTVHAIFVIGSFAFGSLFVAFSFLAGIGIYKSARKVRAVRLNKATAITPISQ
jgi:hypothetical protein